MGCCICIDGDKIFNRLVFVAEMRRWGLSALEVGNTIGWIWDG